MAALLSGILGTVVACGGDGPGERSAAAEPARSEPREAIRGFAALRRPAAPGDRFAPSPRPDTERLTLSYAEARLVYRGASARAWALPGEGTRDGSGPEMVLCLYRQRTAGEQPGIDGACAPARSARRRGVAFVTNGDTPGTLLVVGLVPDGVERVRFAVDGETPRGVRVRGNYYETAVSGPGRASFEGPAGAHRFPFGGFPG